MYLVVSGNSDVLSCSVAFFTDRWACSETILERTLRKHRISNHLNYRPKVLVPRPRKGIETPLHSLAPELIVVAILTKNMQCNYVMSK